VTVRQVADRFMEFARGHYGADSSRIPHYHPRSFRGPKSVAQSFP
jgi:hypothetical protein